jgi:hypothetical protein
MALNILTGYFSQELNQRLEVIPETPRKLGETIKRHAGIVMAIFNLPYYSCVPWTFVSGWCPLLLSVVGAIERKRFCANREGCPRSRN